MSYTTQCKKDEDFGSVWGSGGKTAKMKGIQECINMGYYTYGINDCGGWKFSVACSDMIPVDWSAPYSDESARELGYANRNDAALASCIKKGYMEIDQTQWSDRGNWFFSVKCSKPNPKPQKEVVTQPSQPLSQVQSEKTSVAEPVGLPIPVLTQQIQVVPSEVTKDNKKEISKPVSKSNNTWLIILIVCIILILCSSSSLLIGFSQQQSAINN